MKPPGPADLEDRSRGADRLCDGQLLLILHRALRRSVVSSGGRIHCPSAGTPARRVGNLYCERIWAAARQNASRRRCRLGDHVRPRVLLEISRCQHSFHQNSIPFAWIVQQDVRHPHRQNFPSCRIGLPTCVWTMPPVAARSSGPSQRSPGPGRLLHSLQPVKFPHHIPERHHPPH